MALMKLFLSLTLAVIVNADPAADWWKHGVFYQIYPRSFMDSDGDGIGDIKGIASRLHHLKEAGVTATWLSPIYKSPQVDAGYDISDFKAISEEYGTMEDFKNMITKAKELGIKIIMDFVPNHSSDKHDWFLKSEARVEGYEDFYIWADGKNNDDITPPNNWLSEFKYSAWQYSKIRKQWYYHEFAIQQPDLNYRNARVVSEMKDVLRFWMDHGVDGFRMDAVPFLFETVEQKDEPLSGKPNVTEIEPDYLIHIYTRNQPETYDMIYQFREFIEEYNNKNPGDHRIMMTEAYAPIKETMLYYGNGTRLGAHFTFNFELITSVSATSSAKEIVASINMWMDNMPKQFIANWVIGNHDNHRVATRIGVKNVDGFNMLVAVLPGVGVTYNGEEIGMEDGYVSWEQGNDPNACNGIPENFNKSSRDFERTPFHWDNTKNAGFSTADETWLPVSEKYLDNNLEQQKNDPNSHFGIYKKLIKLRKESNVLQKGTLDIVGYSDRVIALMRAAEGEKSLVLLFNIGGGDEVVDISEVFHGIAENVKVVVSANYPEGLQLNSNNIKLMPHQSVILEEV